MDLIRKGGIPFLFALSFLSACQNGPKNPSDQGEKAADGERIYQERCASCHGEDGQKGLSGAKNLTRSELSMEERIRIIRKGKGAMIPFKNSLSKKEIRAVARYLNEFKKSE